MRVPLPRGVAAALGSALLFGVSTPLAKMLLGSTPPVLLASLLYLGSGSGLLLVSLVGRGTGRRSAPLRRPDVPWLAGAVLSGGVLAPVLLMLGLRLTPASTAALLLNLESLLTALLAWFVFHENFDRRIAAGMVLIVAGGVLLSGHGRAEGSPVGALLVAAACLCWAVDNNLSQKVSAADPVVVAAVKGLVAGAVNLGVAQVTGGTWPPMAATAGAMALGFVAYGLSLVLFMIALSHLGTARTGAYFALAPFLGAASALVLLGERPGPLFFLAAGLMAAGAWLHITERHEHAHTHEAVVHGHSHVHDEHHQHDHPPGVDPREPHTHTHAHEPVTHAHRHYPDVHHRHRHR